MMEVFNVIMEVFIVSVKKEEFIDFAMVIAIVIIWVYWYGYLSLILSQ